MTAKEKLEAEERKYHLYCIAKGKCQVCGKRIEYRQTQLAHLIPKTKANLKAYGSTVINHDENMRIVCSLSCNSAVLKNIATHPIEAKQLIKKIQNLLEENDG